ncbi:MAG: hypothetical protein WBG46_12805 [Nonlabens sp.]
MKKFVVLLFSLFLVNCSFSQNRECFRGDCKDFIGFASLTDGNGKSTGYEVGFYKNGLLHGLGNRTGKDGKFWGNYKNGKKNGLFRYVTDGNIYALGNFVDDKMVGMHIVRTKNGYEYPNYDKGSPPMLNFFPANPSSTCPYGDCENGYGIKIIADDAISGYWKDGKSEGMTIIFSASEERVLFGSMKDGKWDGVVSVMNFDNTDEIYVVENGVMNGNYLTRTKNNKHDFKTYENGREVKKYEFKAQ